MLDPKNLNIVMLIDRSGSMTHPVRKGSSTPRWDLAMELTTGFATAAAAYDDDGIDVHFFSGTVESHANIVAEKTKALFAKVQPFGSTATDLALDKAFADHFGRKAKGETKSTLVVCVTDGKPADEAAVEKVLAKATTKVDNADELSVGFLQVGDDADATAFLTRIDARIPGARHDIVKTLTCDQAEALGSVEAIINRFLEH